MKKPLIGLLVLGVLFSVFFFVQLRVVKNHQNPVVAVLIPGSVEFFAVQRKGMDQAAREYGLNLIYADAEWEAAKQLSQVEHFISQGVDLILICSVDNLALQSAIPLVQRAKIPLITFSNTIGGDRHGHYKGVITHVGRDEVKGGGLLGQMVEQLFGDQAARIVFIQGTPGTSAQRMREEGFEAVVKQHANWKIVYNQYVSGWTKEGALNAMEDFLQTAKEADIIVTQWWTASVSAAMALREKGTLGTKIVGLEFSGELASYIRSKQVSSSTYFSIAEEGFKAVETAARFLKKEEVPQFVEIVPVWVTAENVDRFQPEL
ncbi:MAG: sugar ABC transporter substrate-binding protein [Deltaproteobacteria bacterium]|nr:sugar ABC transporter substrate-binding protein [Deltaproteobacteria bacterium]